MRIQEGLLRQEPHSDHKLDKERFLTVGWSPTMITLFLKILHNEMQFQVVIQQSALHNWEIIIVSEGITILLPGTRTLPHPSYPLYYLEQV